MQSSRVVKMSEVCKEIDANCPYVIRDSDDMGFFNTYTCKLMEGEQAHKCNCGMYPCPIGKKSGLDYTIVGGVPARGIGTSHTQQNCKGGF